MIMNRIKNIINELHLCMLQLIVIARQLLHLIIRWCQIGVGLSCLTVNISDCVFHFCVFLCTCNACKSETAIRIILDIFCYLHSGLVPLLHISHPIDYVISYDESSMKVCFSAAIITAD